MPTGRDNFDVPQYGVDPWYSWVSPPIDIEPTACSWCHAPGISPELLTHVLIAQNKYDDDDHFNIGALNVTKREIKLCDACYIGMITKTNYYVFRGVWTSVSPDGPRAYTSVYTNMNPSINRASAFNWLVKIINHLYPERPELNSIYDRAQDVRVLYHYYYTRPIEARCYCQACRGDISDAVRQRRSPHFPTATTSSTAMATAWESELRYETVHRNAVVAYWGYYELFQRNPEEDYPQPLEYDPWIPPLDNFPAQYTTWDPNNLPPTQLTLTRSRPTISYADTDDDDYDDDESDDYYEDDDEYYEEDGDRGREGVMTIHNYGYKPDAIYYHVRGENADRVMKFGVEFEVNAKTETALADMRAGFYYLRNICYFKRDGSLEPYRGVEIVTHPGSLAWWQQGAGGFLEAMENNSHLFNSYFDNHCGLHIHCSRNNVVTATSIAMTNLVYGNPTGFRFIAERNSDYGTMFPDSDETPTEKALYGNSRRGEALNFGNSQTIEFRMFRPSPLRKRLLKNVEAVHAIWAYSKYVGSTHPGIITNLREGQSNRFTPTPVRRILPKELTFNSWKNWVEAQDAYPNLNEFIAARAQLKGAIV